jgi:3-hydroxyisobutyrate dehydrogenase/2-hydroxy-3-oxopropionate reductase
MMVHMTAVAVIGLGAMGGRFARRFLDAGHEVIVWNRSTVKATELLELGALWASSPSDAAQRAEAIVTIVSDAAALRAVTEGPDGLAEGADGSTTVVEMSTVGPEAIAWLRSELPDEVGLVDAPVLGSLSEAEGGTLKLFVGGAASLVERWTPLLAALGSPIHVGPLGAGASAKLIANSTLFGTLTLLGEVVALADGLGLSRDVTFDVLAATPLAGPAERRRPSIEAGEYPHRFTLSLARKDATLITDAARSAGVDLRLMEAARTWLADAEESGFGDRDYSTILARIIGVV